MYLLLSNMNQSTNILLSLILILMKNTSINLENVCLVQFATAYILTIFGNAQVRVFDKIVADMSPSISNDLLNASFSCSENLVSWYHLTIFFKKGDKNIDLRISEDKETKQFRALFETLNSSVYLWMNVYKSKEKQKDLIKGISLLLLSTFSSCEEQKNLFELMNDLTPWLGKSLKQNLFNTFFNLKARFEN